MRATPQNLRDLKAAHRRQASPVDLADLARPRRRWRPYAAGLAVAASLAAGAIVLWPDPPEPPPVVATTAPTPAPELVVEVAPPPRRSLAPPRLPTIRQAAVALPARPPVLSIPRPPTFGRPRFISSSR